MSELDQEYYLIMREPGRDNLPSLTPVANTQNRDFRYARQPMGSAPLFFFNGFKERHAKRGIAPLSTPPRILFSGHNPLVPDEAREILLGLDIPGLLMHPAVYIHDDDHWYENYWFLAVEERFDCWDRKNSVTVKSPPIQLGGFELFGVNHFSLNKDLMLKTPLKNRLLFQMGGVTEPFFVCHQSLYRLFNSLDGGIELVRLDEY